ncbi:MAG: type II toxin-antitoxin system RelE/ParE family toxin [Chthoniobacterales bacterium]|nr:type II toxin-antitoxin system RelE/ParE family toxin [Chthoniobacterales bacterium]
MARRFRIEYGNRAIEDLESLPARIRQQVLRKIGRFQSGLHGDIKRLREADRVYRLRMGNHRILFDVSDDLIIIRRIGNRKNVYD